MRATGLFAVLLLSACGGEADEAPAKAPAPVFKIGSNAEPKVAPKVAPEVAPKPWSDAWLEREAQRYLDDPQFRRAQLEASLTNPDNQYSRKRLASYGLGDRGWDALPEWLPATAPITNDQLSALREADQLPTPSATIWDGRRPTTLAEWVALGERVFFDYPLRPEPFARHALRNPELGESVGLRPDADGRWPGVVAFVDLDGETRVGITCALCHVGEDASAQLVVGRARRKLDYGLMHLAFYRDTGTPLDPRLAERMGNWGPGRADITDDADEDPVAIPDLWGIRELRYLTQAATLRHDHPAALAIRQETQLLHANRERTRPPRELAWALTMYVYSLAPPPRAKPIAPRVAVRGQALFERSCAGCHSEPSGAGEPIPAGRVGTDRALAFGHARGTGLYRPAPLVRVADAGPYLHDGSVESLEDLLDPARLEHTPGHRFATDRPAPERDALLAYLRTL